MVLPVLGLFNAWVNVYARNGGVYGTLWVFISANITMLPWLLLVKKSEVDLSVAGAAFDAVYSLFYFLAIVFVMSQPATPLQWVGVLVTIAGIALMAL